MKLLTNHFNHLTALLICATSVSVEAKVLFWPDLCTSPTLIVENKTALEKNFWLQRFSADDLDETEYVLTSKQTLKIDLTKQTEAERSALLHFNEANALSVQYECEGVTYPATDLDGADLTYKKIQNRHPKLWMQNTFTGRNAVQVDYRDAAMKVLKGRTIQLDSQETLSLVEDSINWSYVTVSSTNRLISYLLDETGSSPAVKTVSHVSTPETDGTYFLVNSKNSDDDSFVVKITDAKLIEKARYYAQHPETEKIVFATVEKDHQGFNRNMSLKTKPLWSWSTTAVTGFGDFGSTSCNGQPQELEDRVDRWIGGVGNICFWSYRIKRELTSTEVSGRLPKKTVSTKP